MNRIKEINKFLKYYAKIYVQNPKLDITSDTIYDGLKKYGYKDKELKSLSNLFNPFIEKYTNSKTLHVYKSKKQKCFLRFYSKNLKKDPKHIKLYISYKEEDMYTCASKIFDFIDQNNIMTASKIADETRADSIVLRLYAIEDAIKVINFINNDRELKKKAKSTNPFLFKQGVIGMAYDEYANYNGILSMLIAEYYKECRNNNTLKNVSIEGLIYFIQSYESKNFNDINNIKNYKNSDIYKKYIKQYTSYGEFITSINNIIKLIIKELDNKFDINDYFNIIKDFRNEQNDKSKYYNQIDIYSNNTYTLFIDALQATYKKYDLNKEQLAELIRNCIQNNYNNITNDNNYRNLVRDLIKPDDIFTYCTKFLKEMKIDFQNKSIVSTFADTLCNKFSLERTEDLTEDINQIKTEYRKKYDLFINAITYTIQKYNIDEKSIIKLIIQMMNGNYENIARGDNNYREQLQKNINPSDIEIILQMHLELSGYDINKIDDIKTTFANTLYNQLKQDKIKEA